MSVMQAATTMIAITKSVRGRGVRYRPGIVGRAPDFLRGFGGVLAALSLFVCVVWFTGNLPPSAEPPLPVRAIGVGEILTSIAFIVTLF